MPVRTANTGTMGEPATRATANGPSWKRVGRPQNSTSWLPGIGPHGSICMPTISSRRSAWRMGRPVKTERAE